MFVQSDAIRDHVVPVVSLEVRGDDIRMRNVLRSWAKASGMTVSPSNSSTMLWNCHEKSSKKKVFTNTAIPHPTTRMTMMMRRISLLVKGSGVSFMGGVIQYGEFSE